MLNIFLNIKGLKNYYQVIRLAPQLYMLPKYEISIISINHDSNNGVIKKIINHINLDLLKLFEFSDTLLKKRNKR